MSGGGTLDIDKCIDFTSQVIERLPNLLDEKRDLYSKMLSSIEHRRKDPYLNVALIGDFSTGKSTFINALIKQNILKTAWIATTAVPTQIYYHIKKDIDVLVDTIDGITYNMFFEDERNKLEKVIGQKLSKDMKEVVTFITTTNDFAEKIKCVKVFCQSDMMFKDICIIDTPGVNPGSDNTKSHVMATRNVLREFADATIVLFQSQNVYTNSFKTFLEENAKHFMNEAVFVITMMDLFEEKERIEIIDFVRKSLRETFNLENPVVLGCCAKYCNETNVSADNMHWCYEFENLRDNMILHINERRQHIIKKQMCFLMLKLIEELDKDIQKNITGINYQIEVLNKNSIEKLKYELAESRIIHEELLREVFDNIPFDKEYRKMFSNIVSSARNSINSCTKIRGTGKEAISGYISEYLPDVISAKQRKFSVRINELFAPANDIVQSYFNENKRLFEKYSINLKKSTNFVIEESYQDFDKDLGQIKYYDGGSVQTVLEGIGGIAFGIAVLPIAIFDGILDTDISGTIIKAVGTFTGGLINFFGDLSAKKQDAISSVEKAVNNMRDENQKEFFELTEEREKSLFATIAKIEKKFTTEYKSVFNKRKKELDAEKERMEQEIDNYKSIHETLSDYFSELASERICKL